MEVAPLPVVFRFSNDANVERPSILAIDHRIGHACCAVQQRPAHFGSLIFHPSKRISQLSNASALLKQFMGMQ